METVDENNILVINLGYFTVDQSPATLDTETTTLKLYDAMASLQNTIYVEGSIEYPITVANLAKTVGEWFHLKTENISSLPNADYEIKEDLYAKISNTNYRNILAEIAGATVTMAYVDRENNEIKFRPPQKKSQETLTYDNLKTVKIDEEYGPINSVVLARTPQEDNIAVSDSESVDKDGLTEVKLANNEIMDDERELFAQPILDVVDGIKWTGFECTTEGHGWYEIGDRITITDGENSWEGIVTSISMTIDGGFKETLKGVIPDKTTTDYSLAGGIMKTIYNTEIKVDKQNQQIESVVSQVDSIEGQILEQFTKVEQNLTGIITTIQTTGGGNLIHNSVGYNITPEKKLVNWEQTGEVGSESSPESRSYGGISGNQIDLGASSRITQRVIVDGSGSQVYTLSLRAKKGVTGTVTIHLKNNVDDFTIVIPPDKAVLWESFSLVGIQPSTIYFDVITETDEDVANFSMTDLTLTVGDSTTPWVSASDEILSKNVAVDSNGITVRSSTTNDYVTLDELGLNGYSDASGRMENVFTISRDETEVSKLKARNQITMPPIKIVPIKSGSRAGWCFVKEGHG